MTVANGWVCIDCFSKRSIQICNREIKLTNTPITSGGKSEHSFNAIWSRNRSINFAVGFAVFLNFALSDCTHLVAGLCSIGLLKLSVLISNKVLIRRVGALHGFGTNLNVSCCSTDLSSERKASLHFGPSGIRRATDTVRGTPGLCGRT